MKAYAVSEHQLKSMIEFSTTAQSVKDLFYLMMQHNNLSLTEYFYEVLSSYMLNYISFNDETLSREESFRIYSSFSPILNKIGKTQQHVKSVDPFDVLYNISCVDLYGNFNSNLYDDLFEMLVATKGEEAVDQMQDICELINHVITSLEGYYINFTDSVTVTRVMVAMTTQHLLIYAV